MADSPMFGDRKLAEAHAERWYRLCEIYPKIKEFKQFDQFAAWRKEEGRLEVPLYMWAYKEIADILEAPPEQNDEQEATTEDAHAPKKVKKEPHTTSPAPATFWLEAKKTDGTTAQYLEEDQRFQKLVEMKTAQWNQDNPKATPAERAAYFSEITLMSDNPLDKLIPIHETKPKIWQEAEELLGHIHPEAITIYQENERTRIHSDGNDPKLNEKLLGIKKDFSTYLTEHKDAETKPTDEEMYSHFVKLQLSAMHAFAKEHPEKAEGYSQQGYAYITKALELIKDDKEPTDEDVKSMIKPEGLQGFSSIFNPKPTHHTEPTDENLPPIVPFTKKTIYSPITGDDSETDDEGEILSSDDDEDDSFDDIPERESSFDRQDMSSSFDAPSMDESSDDDRRKYRGPNYPRERTGMMDRANNAVEKVRNLRGLGKKLKMLRGLGGAGGGAAAAPAAPAAIAAGGISGGTVLIIIIIIILLLLIIWFTFFNNARDPLLPPVQVNLQKTGPTAVGNGSEVQYSIQASVDGVAQDVMVYDILPVDATFVSASGRYNYDQGNHVVSWSLKENQGAVGSSPAPTAQSVDTSKYKDPPYSLPIPDGPSDATYSSAEIQKLNDLGSTIRQYSPYLKSKVKNNNENYVDPFVAVIWSGAIEGTRGNNYSWNCLDRRSRGQQDGINLGCIGGFKSGGWQVSYGIQVAQAVNHLFNDFNAVYGVGSADNVQKVYEAGQAVIDNSAQSSAGQITRPSSFPTGETIDSLVTKAKAGDPNAQQAVAILLMDPKVGALSVSLEIAGDIARQDNWRATMEGWNAYYRNNMQKFANRMQELASKYTATGGSTFITKTFTVTIRPNSPDSYLVNQASARVIGGEALTPTPQTPGGNPDVLVPSTEVCAGSNYLFWMETLPAPLTNMNYGDPECRIAGPDAVDIISNFMHQEDPDNANDWVTVVIPCVSAFEPNKYDTDKRVDGTYGWGLLQMGASVNGPGSAGPGPNGTYDRGDVNWTKQLKNAIAYNRDLESRGQKWQYWPTDCRP